MGNPFWVLKMKSGADNSKRGLETWSKIRFLQFETEFEFRPVFSLWVD